MDYLNANVLNQHYLTEGAFYQIELEGKSYHCRGLARITKRGSHADTADALVVMVNPGSSQPIDKKYVIPPYNENLMEIPMVEANSDQTQHQLMRLMESRGWEMIFIINLSDLIDGSLAGFQDALQVFRNHKNNKHSIFSGNRREQLNALISTNTKIIVGWGIQPIKKEEMYEALRILGEYGKIFGVSHQTSPYYLHPKPALIDNRKQWLVDMNNLLDEEEEERNKSKVDISTAIVREILKDIHGRMGLEDEFRSIHPKVQVEMFERWIEVVSMKLYQEGMIDKVYEPINIDEMSLGEIVNRTVHYLSED